MALGHRLTIQAMPANLQWLCESCATESESRCTLLIHGNDDEEENEDDDEKMKEEMTEDEKKELAEMEEKLTAEKEAKLLELPVVSNEADAANLLNR